MQFVKFIVQNRGTTPKRLGAEFGGGFLLVSRSREARLVLGEDLPTAPYDGLLGGVKEGLGNSELHLLSGLLDGDGVVRVGSGRGVAILLDHDSVAGVHACIRKEPTGWTLEAAAFNARILLNQEGIRPGTRHPLKGGEHLILGVPFSCTFHTARSLTYAMRLADSSAAEPI